MAELTHHKNEYNGFKSEQKNTWNVHVQNLITSVSAAQNDLLVQKNTWNVHVQNLITGLANLQNDYNGFKSEQKNTWNVHVTNLITWINNLQTAHNDHKHKIKTLIECSHALGHCVHLPKLDY